MENQTIGSKPRKHPVAALGRTDRCKHFQAAIRVITGKWKGEILYALIGGTRRFGELRRAVPGITQHMLTMQLRELEAHGLVRRTVFAEVPPRVEYQLTAAAHDLRPIFEAIWHWSQSHLEALDLPKDSEIGVSGLPAQGRHAATPPPSAPRA